MLVELLCCMVVSFALVCDCFLNRYAVSIGA